METYTLRSLPKHFIIFTPRAKSSDVDSIYDYLKTQIYQGWLKTLNPDKPKTADHIITKQQVIDWMIQYRPDLAIENNFLKQ